MKIDATNVDFQELNEMIKAVDGDVEVDGCLGQRFIGVKRSSGKLIINGTPGNALGAYLDGCTIEVNGNVQDAVGDTMNDGEIIVHGNAGDALGLAMRGGNIFVRGDVGYRAGVHMKEYKEKRPVIVIGGGAGSFLGEYSAGGLIIVLGIGYTKAPISNFTGTGMHGGKIFIRTEAELPPLPAQVIKEPATAEDLDAIAPYVKKFSEYFGQDITEILKDKFVVLRPNAKNPYKALYVAN